VTTRELRDNLEWSAKRPLTSPEINFDLLSPTAGPATRNGGNPQAVDIATPTVSSFGMTPQWLIVKPLRKPDIAKRIVPSPVLVHYADSEKGRLTKLMKMAIPTG
jgi:hypothetical protein